MSMVINNARSPRWADFNKTLIDVEVDFDALDEEYVLFTASPNDCEAHGRAIFAAALNGDYGVIADYVPPADKTGDAALDIVRGERDELLKSSDVYVLPDRWAGMTAAKQSEWSMYRQALRDITAHASLSGLTYSWVEASFSYAPSVTIPWPTMPA